MQMRDSSKLVKKSCTAKGRHDARQGASAKSLLPCCIHHYARVIRGANEGGCGGCDTPQ